MGLAADPRAGLAVGALWLAAGSVAALVLAALLARQAIVQGRGADRLRGLILDKGPAEATHRGGDGEIWLVRWLARAGMRRATALPVFVTLAAAAALFGMGVPLFLSSIGVFAQLTSWISESPGGIGEGLAPVMLAGPVILGVLIAAAPWMVVRRRRRVLGAAVDRDMPITLELLATLAEAGLGFDAALARILDSQTTDRPLTGELRLLQLELRSGRPRVECFRRFRERLDIPAVNTFVSALLAAEHLGASVSDVLRTQAQEVRGQTRERALAQAQSLPVKLIFPMLFCFLPGIFVVTLGPAFYQLFQIAEQVIRQSR